MSLNHLPKKLNWRSLLHSMSPLRIYMCISSLTLTLFACTALFTTDIDLQQLLAAAIFMLLTVWLLIDTIRNYQ